MDAFYKILAIVIFVGLIWYLFGDSIEEWIVRFLRD